MKGLFVFRRDLRIVDNTGLYDLVHKCDEVYCIFILDPKQISPKLNKFFSMNAARFMIDCLIDLKNRVNLTVTSGDPVDVIANIVNKNDIDIIGFNEDYTRYAVKRDEAIEKKIHSMKKTMIKYKDVCLNSPDTIKPYKVFTPYYDVVKKIKVAEPIVKKLTNIKKT